MESKKITLVTEKLEIEEKIKTGLMAKDQVYQDFYDV